MRKWFVNLTSKTQRLIICCTWLTFIILFFLIGLSPEKEELSTLDVFMVWGFIFSFIFGIIFSIWMIAEKIIQKIKEKRPSSPENSTDTLSETINKNTNLHLTVIDVETPNKSQNSVCSIGILSYKNEELIYKRSLLINPEADFDEINMRIHGITPKIIENAPTLKIVWDEISPYILNSIVIGHNIRSDLTVLKKALSSYGLRLPTITYVDTMVLAKKYINASSYKLSDLVSNLNAGSVKHDALSDCLDCKLLFDHLQKKFHFNIYAMSEEYYIEHLVDENWEAKKTSGIYKSSTPSSETIAYKKLQQFAERIVADNDITDAEITEFIKLAEENNVQDIHPISVAYQMAKKHISSDKIVEVLNTLTGEIQLDSFDGVFDGKIFCLTGDFAHGSKLDVQTHIISKGGIIKDNVTQKVHYLVRGLNGSDMYAYGSYGGKVKKALENKAKVFL